MEVMSDSAPSSWSDEDIESVLVSIILITAVTLAAWLILRPALPKHPQQQPQQAQQRTEQQTRAGAPAYGTARTVPRTGQRSQNHFNREGDEDGILTILAKHTRVPPHHQKSSPAVMVQHDGIVPFRSTRAATYESNILSREENFKSDAMSNSGDSDKASVQLTNRKDRARIFTKLFSSTRTSGTNLINPPPRGSNVIISIPESDIGCEKLRRVLYLLGTYYNLFVLLSLRTPQDFQNTVPIKKTDSDIYIDEKVRMENLISSLRGLPREERVTQGDCLPEEVLPSHRIVASTSITGRVAFVRQFPKKPEFVLDYEMEAFNQLDRFGFTVLLYESAPVTKVDEFLVNSQVVATSGLGMELIPS